MKTNLDNPKFNFKRNFLRCLNVIFPRFVVCLCANVSNASLCYLMLSHHRLLCGILKYVLTVGQGKNDCVGNIDSTGVM